MINNISSLITSNLPIPLNISNIWNFGRCLGLFLVVQIISGLLLARHYTPDITLAFDSISDLRRDIVGGALLRIIHLNGASIYFLFLYLHIARGLYYKSYSYLFSWLTGFTIIFLSILVAFLGYVLPWGQISYWGATVITNLLSAVPLVGSDIVGWIWGGFRVSNPTLRRFFIIHFCVPFILVSVVALHVLVLHNQGSQNPSNILSKYNLLRFHPFFVLKDIVFFFLIFLVFEFFIFLNPYFLGDPENFVAANMMRTPEHIVPEWYFLFAYAILRRVPWKGIGVLRILMAVFIILVPCFKVHLGKNNLWAGLGFRITYQNFIWLYFFRILVLTWLGGRTVTIPFIALSRVLFLVYFIRFLVTIAIS